MTISEALSYRIQILCKERGYNVSQLARKSRLPRSTVYNVAKGKVKDGKMDTLARIAMGFGMSLAEFLRFPEMDNCEID